ncbi:DNA-directed primase/polymerase protein-like [Glandiceps talaboti]
MATFSPPKLTLAQEKKLSERRWTEKLETLEQKEEVYKQHVLAPEYKPRLIDPSPMWREFVRQKEAFGFADSFNEDMHVFAVDMDEFGQKRYIVTSYQQLKHTVFQWNGNEPPHFYEIIPEGAACHLYFDLEYSKEYNTNCDGVQMVNTLIECVCHFLEEIYDIQCDRRNVIDLDSTTDKKFSRHLIFQLPGAAFRNNSHAGSFVNHVCTSIANHITRSVSHGTDENDNEEAQNSISGSSESREEPKVKRLKVDNIDQTKEQCFLSQHDLQKLFIKNKNGEKVIFVDQGVYTRNRNFRLFKCAKEGKPNILELSAENQYQPKLSSNSRTPMEHQVFLDSLISNVSFSSKLQILDCESDFVRRAVKLDSSIDPSHSKDGDVGSSSTPKTTAEDVVEGLQNSPYPDLDDFITTQINKGGIQGEIRKWTYFTQGGLIVYDILKNRWCGNIGRQHKSNNIIPLSIMTIYFDRILVDLKQGVFYQKCHDPDCKAQNYKSTDLSVPSQYLPTFSDDVDDDELLKILVELEREGASDSDCHSN